MVEVNAQLGLEQRSRFQIYAGNGSTLADRGLVLPPPEIAPWRHHPAGYIAEESLRDAVNVALALGQPLLVTGEPGTGKTELAGSIAYELGLGPPLVFNTKSGSTARDLFYRYDSLRHFHDAQFTSGSPDIERYIEYEALGRAILRAADPAMTRAYLPVALHADTPVRSVVLIDEIDKAPRDLPNDVLNEIEQMAFSVKETGRSFQADPAFKPIVLLTSNSEKTLPEAFLRRCVFYHISFPSPGRLRRIVQQRMSAHGGFTPEMLEHAIQHFEQIRELGLRKKPSTAELLAWLQVLSRLQIDVAHLKPGEAEAVAFTYSALVKSKEDMSLVLSQLQLEN